MRKSGTSITGHRRQGAAMQALHRPLHPNACLDKEREVGAGRTNWGATSRILHEERFGDYKEALTARPAANKPGKWVCELFGEFTASLAWEPMRWVLLAGGTMPKGGWGGWR